MNEIIGYILASVIGLLLGLLGGGGAILTIPVLVYLFQVSPFLATTYSLFIVGISSGAGAIRNWKNMIPIKYILLFAAPSTLAIIVIRNYLLPLVPDHLFNVGGFNFSKDHFIMTFFSLLLVVSGILMLVKRKNAQMDGKVAPWWKFLLLGYVEGSITGIVGAGGGFIIVPVLVFLSKLDMKKAIAASLFIVSIKSLISFFLSPNLAEVNWVFISIFTGISLAGMFLGIYLSKKIDTVKLKILFGVFLILMSIFIIIKEFVLK